MALRVTVISRLIGASACIATLLSALVTPARASTLAASDIADLSLEQLGNIVVTSVSRRDEPLGSAAASIYVITNEDIRRSGAKSIPEALRLAPNLDVSRADANQYAISARGFANVLANRLLVLIDGRIVFSPLFSGVFWEAQDVVLEDVERIEVISGPGATLYGTNGVNGVINVVTKRAADTQGALAAAGGGNRERGAVTRYGGTLGGGGHYRVYGKYTDRSNTSLESGASVRDASTRAQAGFRADWGDPGHGFTFQGDVYRNDIEQPVGGSRDLGGVNLIGRWRRVDAAGLGLQAQIYYDRVERDQPGSIREDLDIVDVEVQHGFVPLANHRFLWGAGYRYANDRIDNVAPAVLGFLPANRALHWFNVFAQDEWRLRPDLALTLGLRAERNDYSGFEFLPNVRLAWTLTPQRLLWTSLSRAVRAPSRLDRELFAPATPPFLLAGGPNFQSEVTKTAELGFRAQETRTFSYSITAFHHQHERLRSIEPGAANLTIENRMHGHTNGVEAWARWRPFSNWRLDAGWTELRQHLGPESGSAASVVSSGLGNDPRHWMTLRSSLDITPQHEFDVMVRHFGARPNPSVPSYTAVDARLGWRVSRELELSASLENLLDDRHVEWGALGTRVALGRGFFLKAVWRP